METFVAWIQENHLPLLGTQLAVVVMVALWIGLRRIRSTAAAEDEHEPAEGDRRTVVLPEEDAAQMFETLTALQEELEKYRKPGAERRAAEEEREFHRAHEHDNESASAMEAVTTQKAMERTAFEESWDLEESQEQEPLDKAVTDEIPQRSERPETEPVEEVSPADRVLRSWLEDVERLARRARRDSL